MNENNFHSIFSLMIKHPTENILNFSKLHINRDCQLNASGDGPYFYGMLQPDQTVSVVCPANVTLENDKNNEQGSSCNNFVSISCKPPCCINTQSKPQYWLSVARDKSLLVTTTDKSTFSFSNEWEFVIERKDTCSFTLQTVEICNNETNKKTTSQEWLLSSFDSKFPAGPLRIDTKIYVVFHSSLNDDKFDQLEHGSNNSFIETSQVNSFSSSSNLRKKRCFLEEFILYYLCIFAAVSMLI